MYIFYILLVKMYNFEQSAGNQKYTYVCWVGSSETTRNPCNKDSKECYSSGVNKFIMRRYSPLNKNYILLHSTKRNYNTTNNNIINDKFKYINPLMIYDNFKENKIKIFKDQKNKSGVYCLVNNTNGHSYVGSSISINSRMKNYLNNTFLNNKKNINMPIIKALLKYDQSKFSLLILEYVDIKNLSIRETLYITSIIPYYNVLKQGYSSLGYKHTEETKRLLYKLAKNRKHNDLTKSLISKVLVGENNPFYNKNHSVESKVRMIEANSLYPVYVYNSDKILLVIFPSVLTLAKKINSNHRTIVKFIKNQNLFRGEWYFSNIPYHIKEKPFINKWTDENSKNLVLEMINCNYIKKAVFVYDLNKNLLFKYDGVTKAQNSLNINHSIIKKNAIVKGSYKNYIFSYEKFYL